MTGRHHPATHEAARDEVRALGFEPMEPYPGRTDKPWKLRCLTCGRVRPHYLSNIRQGQLCAHTRGRLTTDEAAKELLDAGYEPLDPYPGRVGRPWRSRCLVCGAVRHPSVNNVRQGQVCKHRPIVTDRPRNGQER